MSKISVLSFAKETISYIFNPNEKFHKWGKDNLLSFEYLKLYQTVPEHASSIDFITDLVIGEGLSSDKLDYWTAKKIVEDYNIFGGFTLQVIKLRGGDYQLCYVDISKCRFSKDKKQIGYADEGWELYKQDYIWYNITDSLKTEGIFYYKNNSSRSLYPTPSYKAVIKSLETMGYISDYHNNNAANGFSPSVLINFNNGVADSDTQKSIEKGIQDKFTGSQGTKFIMSFNETPENKTTIEHLTNDNLDEKFETLQKFIQNQIIVSHRITSGTLLGIKPENQGFSKTEYQEALDVFKEVTINGIRKELEYAFSLLLKENVVFNDKKIIDVVPTTPNTEGGQLNG